MPPDPSCVEQMPDPPAAPPAAAGGDAELRCGRDCSFRIPAASPCPRVALKCIRGQVSAQREGGCLPVGDNSPFRASWSLHERSPGGASEVAYLVLPASQEPISSGRSDPLAPQPLELLRGIEGPLCPTGWGTIQA